MEVCHFYYGEVVCVTQCNPVANSDLMSFADCGKAQNRKGLEKYEVLSPRDPEIIFVFEILKSSQKSGYFASS